MAVLQLDAKLRVRQRLRHLTLHLNRFFFGHTDSLEQLEQKTAPPREGARPPASLTRHGEKRRETERGSISRRVAGPSPQPISYAGFAVLTRQILDRVAVRIFRTGKMPRKNAE